MDRLTAGRWRATPFPRCRVVRTPHHPTGARDAVQRHPHDPERTSAARPVRHLLPVRRVAAGGHLQALGWGGPWSNPSRANNIDDGVKTLYCYEYPEAES